MPGILPRPFFPHTMNDLAHAVDGPLGLVVGDMPDGTLFDYFLKQMRLRAVVVGAPATVRLAASLLHDRGPPTP